jgi:hypothetical protein
MKYKPMDEQMSHEILHAFIKPCVKCIFIAWYLCVKCTNYEWMNFAQFPLLNCEMLSLWCRFKFNIYSTISSFTNAIMKYQTSSLIFRCWLSLEIHFLALLSNKIMLHM